MNRNTAIIAAAWIIFSFAAIIWGLYNDSLGLFLYRPTLGPGLTFFAMYGGGLSLVFSCIFVASQRTATEQTAWWIKAFIVASLAIISTSFVCFGLDFFDIYDYNHFYRHLVSAIGGSAFYLGFIMLLSSLMLTLPNNPPRPEGDFNA